MKGSFTIWNNNELTISAHLLMHIADSLIYSLHIAFFSNMETKHCKSYYRNFISHVVSFQEYIYITLCAEKVQKYKSA